MTALATHLEALPDPRDRGGLRHPLAAILKLAVLAMACGFRGLRAIVSSAGDWRTPSAGGSASGTAAPRPAN